MPRNDDDERDDGEHEVVLLRGRAAESFLAGLGGSGRGADDEEEGEDEDEDEEETSAVEAFRQSFRAARGGATKKKAPAKKAAAKKRGGYFG